MLRNPDNGLRLTNAKPGAAVGYTFGQGYHLSRHSFMHRKVSKMEADALA